MTNLELNEFRFYISDLTYYEKRQLKENQLERLSYTHGDPLTTLSYLETLRLLWY